METRPIMRTRKGLALGLISAGAAVLFAGCPAQPPGPCVVARAFASAIEGTTPGYPYVAQYYLVPGSGTAGCLDPTILASWPAGNFVGAIWSEAYGPVTAVNKLVGWVPEEFGWTNSYTGDYVECSPINDVNYTTPCNDNPVVFGNFTTDLEDSNNTCTVMGTDAGTQLINGIQVTYDFTSTLVYTNASAGEGTQIQANVTITRATATASCSKSYVAIGLWPIALCNVDNDCNPLPQGESVTPPRPLGSGLLPGIPANCNLGLVAQDPIIVPGADQFGGCGTVDTPFINLTLGCGGGAKDNNNTGGAGMCFYVNPSATTFPYVNPGAANQ
jgi:hypothetical protein